MSTIKKIHARQILDSRGNPTIEAQIHTSCGKMAIAAVPSGASTGSREALELRDQNSDIFLGKSVYKAIENINKIIAPKVLGQSVFDQALIDKTMLELDGTEYKKNLGANAILAVSLAAAKVGAKCKNIELFQYLSDELGCPQYHDSYKLPAPLMNIINGGEHASNSLDIQEFMIVPRLKGGFGRNLRAGVEIFHHLKKVLTSQGHSTNVGDEGGFAPNLKSHEEAIECILKAIENANYKPEEEIMISLDVAASEFYKDGFYHFSNGSKKSSPEMIDYLDMLVDKYPMYSVEDGLAEDDQQGWIALTEKIGTKVLSIGDDLFVTNKKILKKGIELKQANSILVKVNQIGSLTETFETMALAKENNISSVISHRSGETADTFIADLAVATSSGHIKTGSASRSDRVEKYNRLLRIEEFLGDKAEYFHI